MNVRTGLRWFFASIEGWTQEPVFPRGDSLEDAPEDLTRCIHAFDEPVLVETIDGRLHERGY